ncbi:MAG: hypothetical protein HKN49_04480 [Gammaproteobacteria bacterium]|nr:hypothetical protein [Gammaproteobacteria bacterium]
MTNGEENDDAPAAANAFPETPWSLVAQGMAGDAEQRRIALERLFSLYWQPVWCAVRYGWDTERDETTLLVKTFFELELSNALAADNAIDGHGRFRDFLRERLQAFMDNRDKITASSTGRDFIDFTSADSLSAEGVEVHDIFDEQWAQSLIERAVQRLENNLAGEQRNIFEIFRAHDIDGERPDNEALAQRVGIDPELVTPALYDARRRLRRYLVEEIHEYALDQDDALRELQWLLG